MKAWVVRDQAAIEPAMTIVFAETASRARALALGTDACDGAEFVNIRARREPRADKLYKGDECINWYDDETRIALARDLCWSCLEESEECFDCAAREFCEKFENMMDELAGYGE